MADFRPKPEEVEEYKKDWIGMKIDLNRFREDFIRTFQGGK
jgi:hypothetical protein